MELAEAAVLYDFVEFLDERENRKMVHEKLRHRYKEKMLLHHPDKGGDSAAFLEAHAAYEILYQHFQQRESTEKNKNQGRPDKNDEYFFQDDIEGPFAFSQNNFNVYIPKRSSVDGGNPRKFGSFDQAGVQKDVVRGPMSNEHEVRRIFSHLLKRDLGGGAGPAKSGKNGTDNSKFSANEDQSSYGQNAGAAADAQSRSKSQSGADQVITNTRPKKPGVTGLAARSKLKPGPDRQRKWISNIKAAVARSGYRFGKTAGADSSTPISSSESDASPVANNICTSCLNKQHKQHEDGKSRSEDSQKPDNDLLRDSDTAAVALSGETPVPQTVSMGLPATDSGRAHGTDGHKTTIPPPLSTASAYRGTLAHSRVEAEGDQNQPSHRTTAGVQNAAAATAEAQPHISKVTNPLISTIESEASEDDFYRPALSNVVSGIQRNRAHGRSTH